MASWRNWSGSVEAAPAALTRPNTEDELAQCIAPADAVRVAGAGHSFMPLCETTGVLVSLEAMEGALAFSDDGARVWAPAGWSLENLTSELWRHGRSLINQGDVNPQALAGAVATGTHGTGATLGSLSTMARGFRLALADGTMVTCSAEERAELFEAQRLSLGLLGVATQIEIETMPAYHLEERVRSIALDEVEQQWDELTSANRHVEFFVFPYGEHALLKTLNPAPGEGELKWMSDFEESAFKRLCDLCAAMPWLTPMLQPWAVRPGLKQRRVGPAFQIFPSERTIRFEEMEYEVPLGNGWSALREVIGWVRKRRLPVTFPFEFRVVAADDIWLSPFSQGPCVSISMHQYAKMPWRDLFADAEKIFRRHGGRPHWAKRHTLTRGDVDALYPRADEFRRVRQVHDPEGKFMNAHLEPLFGGGP